MEGALASVGSIPLRLTTTRSCCSDTWYGHHGRSQRGNKPSRGRRTRNDTNTPTPRVTDLSSPCEPVSRVGLELYIDVLERCSYSPDRKAMIGSPRDARRAGR